MCLKLIQTAMTTNLVNVPCFVQNLNQLHRELENHIYFLSKTENECWVMIRLWHHVTMCAVTIWQGILMDCWRISQFRDFHTNKISWEKLHQNTLEISFPWKTVFWIIQSVLNLSFNLFSTYFRKHHKNLRNFTEYFCLYL